MKKLLLILLSVPLLFSCLENDNNGYKDLSSELLTNGYTGKGTYTDYEVMDEN